MTRARSKSNPAYANLRGLKMKKPKSEEEAKAKTVVFWDINLYPVPSGFDPRQVRPCIERILKDHGYSGPLSVTAVGNLEDVPSDVMRELLPSGVSLVNNGEMKMSGHIYKFLESNEPPATVFTISNPDPRLHYLFLMEEGYNLHQPFASRDTFESFLLAAVSGAPMEERLECDSYWDCFVCGRDPPGRSYETLARHLSSEEHRELALSQYMAHLHPAGPVHGPSLPMHKSALVSVEEFWASITPTNLPHDEINLAAVTSVFWDLKTCPVPSHINPRLVGPQIKRYLEGQGYSGPLTITAVGPLSDFDVDLLGAVFASGINLHHVPHGSEDIANLVFEFYAFNPPPANVVLIMNSPSSDYIYPMGGKHFIISSLEKALTAPGALEADKCPEWVCSVCCRRTPFHGFENLTKHLSDNAHKRKMLDWLPRNARFEHQDNAHGEAMRT